MSKIHNPFASFAGRENKRLKDSFLRHDIQKEETKLLDIEQLVDETNNPYPITELEDLIESIKMYGLEQNLVVRKIDKNLYTIISGHRRFAAIKHIIENDINNEFTHLTEIWCKIIDDLEDEIVVNLRLHETNFQHRNILKLKDDEKLKIIEDYLYWLEKARKENILINGKAIKGKTKDILAEKFNISSRTASRLIASTKGVPNGTPPEKEKTTDEKVVEVVNQLDKINDKIEAMVEELNETQIDQIKRSMDAIHRILMFRKIKEE